MENKDLQIDWHYCEKAIEEGRYIISDVYFELGKMLHEIRAEKKYRLKYKNFPEFIENEFRFNSLTAYRLIKIHEIFFLQFGIQKRILDEAGGWSKVSELLTVTKKLDKAQLVDLLKEASTTTKDNFRKKIQTL